MSMKTRIQTRQVIRICKALKSQKQALRLFNAIDNMREPDYLFGIMYAIVPDDLPATMPTKSRQDKADIETLEKASRIIGAYSRDPENSEDIDDYLVNLEDIAQDVQSIAQKMKGAL